MSHALADIRAPKHLADHGTPIFAAQLQYESLSAVAERLMATGREVGASNTVPEPYRSYIAMRFAIAARSIADAIGDDGPAPCGTVRHVGELDLEPFRLVSPGASGLDS